MPPATERSDVSASASRRAAAAGTPPEEVTSASLVLRRVHAADAAAIAGAVHASLEYLRPWMPWASREAGDPRAQLARVAEADELWESGTDFIYSVVLAGNGTLVGEIGLHSRAVDGGIEIGYWIDVRHCGRGLGTEAARALTSVALALPGVTQAEIHCDEANQASAAIPRKLGYRLDRIDDHEPEAPGERGHRMIWVMERDWRAWHDDYDVPGSWLARRLEVVQDRIRDALDSSPPGPLRAVSMCAGQGRDLIGVLATHPRGREVTARLVELDPGNAAAAREAAAASGLPDVEVVTGDAALADAYAGLIPADIVLACGVFGNITDADIEHTIACCAQLCAHGGTVVWTRGRWEPDLIPQICRWFAEREFDLLWLSDPGVTNGVGAHRFAGEPQPVEPGLRMFSFVGYDKLRRPAGP
jgi:RimJ/RimL family protein N-acetyltransferase